jgi:hypothetical protein
MSNGISAKWKEESIREAEVDHFRKLKAAENFLHAVMMDALAWREEQNAAIAAGVHPDVALLGSRACGLDVDGNPLPEKPAKTDKPPKPAKPAKPRVYQPRVYAPQMIALGARAATILLDLTPMMLDLWKRLVHSGIDPRRLALENDEAKISALLFDEIGVQYRDLDAGDYDRLKAALDRIEVWLNKMKQAEKSVEESTGPPDAGPVEGPEIAATVNTYTPPTVEPAPQEAKSKGEREPATYSAGKDSLDWTKL